MWDPGLSLIRLSGHSGGRARNKDTCARLKWVRPPDLSGGPFFWVPGSDPGPTFLADVPGHSPAAPATIATSWGDPKLSAGSAFCTSSTPPPCSATERTRPARAVSLAVWPARETGGWRSGKELG